MATKKPATKKASKKTSKPTISVEQQLSQALAENPTRKSNKHSEVRTPTVGERVTLGNSPTVFTITRATPTGRDVDLQLPGTTIERFRVPFDDLKFVDAPQSTPSKPAKLAINVEEVREHIAIAQQSSVDQFSGDIAILKKYLKSKGVDPAASKELDDFCEAMQEKWNHLVVAIANLLDE
jgi:hypothetical protein